MADSTPLSYQTTMPDYPDVSRERYQREYLYGTPDNPSTGPASDYVTDWLNRISTGKVSYDTWRSNQLDEYNARMSAYDTWLKSGEGLRASAESGQYNPSYFDGGSSSASPLNYSQTNDAGTFSDMAQGVSGIIQFVQALYGLRQASMAIRGADLANKGQELKNQKQAIENKWLDQLLYNRVGSLGYQMDWRKFQNEAELASRFPSFLGKPLIYGTAGGYARDYDLSGVEKGFGYNRQNADLAFRRASTAVQRIHKELMSWNVKERKFYNQSIQAVQLKLLQHQEGLLKGQLDFQGVRQDLEKKAFYFGVGKDVVNTTLSAIRLFLPGGALMGGASQAPTAFPGVWNSASTWSPGVDPFSGAYYGGVQ